MSRYNRIKVIAADLDGTLTNSMKHVMPYTIQIMQKAAAQGCILTIATGRPLFGVKRVIRELELEKTGGYVLSYNGCLITEVKSGRTIYQKTLPDQMTGPLYEFFKAMPEVNIATYQPGFIYSETNKDTYLQVEAFGCGTPVTVVDYLPDRIKEPIYKYVVTGEPSVISRAKMQTDAVFGDTVGTIISEPFFLEIVPKDINKAASLQRLMEYLQYDSACLAAFGDGRNDVEMLQYAGLSFAMENGCNEAKNAADFVIGSNDEDGVGKAIQQYILV